MLPTTYTDALSAALKAMDDESPFGLRGWVKYIGRHVQDEPAITRELCSRLTECDFRSRAPRYPQTGESCDIVSSLPGGGEVWVEAKLYYTFYFGNGDHSYEAPIPSHSEGHWRNQIRKLVCVDCRGKLLRLLPGREIAGLLLGFEMEDVPLPNPSAKEIDEFLRSQMDEAIPGWRIHALSEQAGWGKHIQDCVRPYKFVTHARLLMPAWESQRGRS
jgi:hypothetical protein